MLAKIQSVAVAVADALTATRTPDTDAAGCDFGQANTGDTRRPAAPRPLIRWRWELVTAEGHGAGWGIIEARDSRAAFRAFSRDLGRYPRFCGFDGPAVAVRDTDSTTKVLPQVRSVVGRDGVECGHVRIIREDGRPTRRRIGGGR